MRVIYVDDEWLAVERFKAIAEQIKLIDRLSCFSSAADAIQFADEEKIDVAFLDIEMPKINGIKLAEHLQKLNPNIKIIFVTAYDNYALNAYEISALGYVVKPYTMERIEAELDKAARMRDIPQKKVCIRTMPNFDVFVDGQVFTALSGKPKELLALIVDRYGGSVTTGQAIACLWENRPNDTNSASLLRMTMKKLRDILTEEGIDFILSKNDQRAIDISALECDYFDLMSGKNNTFSGEYMVEYSWAERTNARLERLMERKRI